MDFLKRLFTTQNSPDYASEIFDALGRELRDRGKDIALRPGMPTLNLNAPLLRFGKPMGRVVVTLKWEE